MARFPDGREVWPRATSTGTITTEARATQGSGTTPSSSRTRATAARSAEMAADEKHALSHRGRAFRALAAALEE